MRRPGARAALLWGGFVAVLVFKLLFVGDKGTGDMDTALGWGHTLLRVGLVEGYTGSNFPIAFQIYEGLVWTADHLGIKDYAAMKWLNLLCDLGTFWGLRALLRGWGASPDWAFLYWLSPYFLVMYWLGFDHFQMGLIVVVTLLLMQRAGSARGWLLASVPLGIAFLQRPQVNVLVAALGAYAAIVAFEEWRATRRLWPAVWNERTRPALLLLVFPVLLFGAYSVWFWAGGKDALYLARAYGGLSAFSPALSANMLNIWAMVAEAYRSGTEQLPTIRGWGGFHALAGVLSAAAMLAGVWAIARRSRERPFSLTALYLFALGSIVLPNVYTRAHENHYFLGLVLLVPLVALMPIRRGALLTVLAATTALQGFNAWAIYGFGQVQLSFDHPFVDVRAWWTWGVRFAAAGVSVALFAGLVALLRPLVGQAGDVRGRA